MAWNGWFAAAPSGRAYLYREYAVRQTKISEWGTIVGKLSMKDKLVDAVLDPSAWQNIGVDKTVAIQLEEVSGVSYRKGDNDRLGGKILLQEYLRWKPRPPKKVPEVNFNPDLAQWIFRNKGMQSYETYLDAFLPEKPEDNLPKLQVFGSDPLEEYGRAPEFIRTIPLCVYKTEGKGDIEDVAEFDGDDPYDGARYGLKAVDRYFNLAKKELQVVQKRDDILAKFAENQDQTYLHRAMERFDREEVARKKPLRRFHRARATTTPFRTK